ncbi:MAG: glutaredoxin family protein [Xanthomonadales bacterium]|jgi:glutaredoxin|nr:glutaredoxin family protein [Xanthomonadales bacterium]
MNSSLGIVLIPARLPRIARTALMLLLGLLFWLSLAGPLIAATAVSGQAPPTEVVVYVREGCPHCAKAKVFLDTLQAEVPTLRIELRPVERPEYAAELLERSEAAGIWPPGVPAFVIGDTLLVGFDDEGRRAAELRAHLQGRVTPAPETRAVSLPAPVDAAPALLPDWLDVSTVGLPAFTLALGLLDGFNPCAMWVLLFLLSLLVRLNDRRRMALIAGTFVLVSGLIYYAFMAAWLNLFLLVGFGTAVRVTLALIALLFATLNLKDGLFGLQGPSLSIPDAAKPGIYARVRALLTPTRLGASLMGVAVLAVLVNTVELLCTAGLPAIYTAVLTQQVEGSGLRYAYLALYIVGYIADDSLMVALAVSALGSRKLSERTGRGLKLLSGAVMLVLGLTLLVKPDWLL